MAIENIMIVDTETTGLDPSKGATIIEIAAVLFSVKYRTVLQSFSTMVPCENNPVEMINNINPLASKCDYPFKIREKDELEDARNFTFAEIFSFMKEKSYACVAHNANFDRHFISMQPWGHILSEHPWICTQQNFTWPNKLKRMRLQDICESMGVAYVNAHRALSDCFLLVSCFQNITDLQERLEACTLNKKVS